MNEFPVVRTATSAAALLGALGMLSAPAAFAVPSPDASLCDTIPLAAPGEQKHQAFGNFAASPGDPGTFEYHLRLCNRSVFPEIREGQIDGFELAGPVLAIADYEIPFFGTSAAQLDGTDSADDNEANIRAVSAPDGWDFAIVELGVADPDIGWDGDDQFTWQEDGSAVKNFFDTLYGGADNNPFNDVTHAIRFYDTGEFGAIEGGGGNFEGCSFEGELPIFGLSDTVICPERNVDGFEFLADFAGTNAPDQSSWALGFPIIPNDPPLPNASGPPVTPNSPTVQLRTTATASEPATFAMLGLGALGLAISGAIRRRRRDA